jgi:glutamine synthetase
MPAVIALTAAGATSYLRLTPHRWSAAFNNLGLQDREAGVRICPVFAGGPAARARQFHFEYRAADAVASPYLLLATLVHAGMAGLDEGLPAPVPTKDDLAAWSPERLAAAGIERLPQNLGEALDRLEGSAEVRGWFGNTLVDAFLLHKRFEARMMAELPAEEQCERYNAAY